MTKVLTTILIILAIAVGAFFYRTSASPELAQISDSITTGENQPRLLPISLTRTPVAQLELQAEAYNNFLRFFGPVSPIGGEDNSKIDFGLVEPVAGFKQNITKKPFGIFITPETSPVENDKFAGYHTGVDSEFTDTLEEVPVLAIADGIVIASVWTTGYGGVVVIKHTIKGVPLFALYGHLDKASFLPTGTTKVKAGDQIGVLGDDHSEETDGARKHLHFSIYIGEKMDFRGYVPTEHELSNWLNPLDLY
jgi:murein DD-endopeptidase MepM/ murein hydrolase activator NlpD